MPAIDYSMYVYYVVAYNAMGKGDASDSIAIKTKGSAPVPPKHVNEFLVVNTTWAHIQPDAWHSNGCPIKEFLIRYRVTKYETEWSEVSAQVWPEDSTFEAVNEAGAGEQNYHFATLTAQGGTVSPLSEREPPLGELESITIVIPGTGPQSEEVYGQTLVMDRPSAPLLTQGDVGYDWIEIVWTFASETNLTVALSQINGYYVFQKPFIRLDGETDPHQNQRLYQ
ncbi:unnamed protein product [Medioppia subpectinata]|uniref:DSCAM/DSCAML C-terminal domain-containing protein n=1 Tax=Medioppia subpectinata TaxID=1979941 RepID=A0A7R9KX85_9ACAR|nr:unnamed protein product [Medioppia subpectinata]CAG2111175.1 unnamed protein product [Medioppia subpectinata]